MKLPLLYPARARARGSSVGLSILLVAAWSRAIGCPYSVRQVGFAMPRSRPYRVYVFVGAQLREPDEFRRAFDGAAIVLHESNVEAQVVDVDRQGDHEALAYRGGTGANRRPAAVLVSPQQRALALGAIDASEDLRALLDRVAASPKRDGLVEAIVEHWCVVLLAESGQREEDAAAKGEVAAAIEAFGDSGAKGGRPGTKPPHLLVVPSDGEEDVLLWCLGLREGRTRSPQAVVLFGPGRQFGPLLAGPSITQSRLLGVLNALAVNCACTTDTSFLSSPVVPLVWGQDVQERVRTHVGVDPRDPTVKMNLARLWKDKGWDGGLDVGLMEYHEGYIELAPEGGEEAVVDDATPAFRPPSPAPRTSAESGKDSPDTPPRPTAATTTPAPSPPAVLPSRVSRRTTLVVTALALVVAVGSTLILWRGRRT